MAKPRQEELEEDEELRVMLRALLREHMRKMMVDEKISFRETNQALGVIARALLAFVNLRKEKPADDGSGTVVRKYQSAFADNAARRRAQLSGPAADDEPDELDLDTEPDFEDDDDTDPPAAAG
jgi:hypothetical protein